MLSLGLGLGLSQQSSQSAPFPHGNLKLMFDSSDESSITKSSNLVSQQNDKSGNDNHAVQGVGAKQPLWVAGAQNGLSVIRYDGIDDVLKTLNTITATDLTIFLVHKYLTAANTRTLYWHNGTTSEGLYFAPFNNGRVVLLLSPLTVLSNLADSSDFVVSTLVKSGGTGTLYKNNVLQQSAAVDPDFGTSEVFMGEDFTGAKAGHVEIGQVYFYDVALSDTHRLSLGSELLTKWGI